MKKVLIASFFLLMVFTGNSFGLDISKSAMEFDSLDSVLNVTESPAFSKSVKVAIVDKSGLNYSDPIAAMDDIANWCGVPSETNRCLIRIMPGIYNLGTNRLTMMSYVDIEGSGENATKIRGRGPEGVVKASAQSELRYLTIEHIGGAEISVAVMGEMNAPSQKLTNMTIISTGGTEKNYGVYYVSDELPPPTPPLVVKNVTVIASGGKESFGIENKFEGGIININRSSIKGDTNSIRNFARVFVYNTVLNGPVGGNGTTTCKRVYDKDYNFYANACP